MKRMMRLVVLVPSVLLACASSRQGAPAQASNDWKPVEVAEIHGRCHASWVFRGLEQSKADAVCDCVVPQLADTFSFRWFNDGQDITPSETEKIKSVELSCVKKFVVAEPQGTGSAAGVYQL